MRIHKKLVLFLLFLLSFSLFATEQDNGQNNPPLFRRFYIWPDFCLEHIKSNPEHISSWSHNVVGGPYLDDQLYENKYLVNAYFDSSTISKTRSYHQFIPQIKNKQCDYIFCTKCNQPVTRERRILKGEFRDDRLMNFPIFYYCKCHKWGIEFDSLTKHFQSECPDWQFSTCTPIWSGYFQKHRSPLFSHFVELLQVCRQNPSCRCYWPEESPKIKEILDEICVAFLRLDSPNISDIEVCNIFFSNWHDCGLYALDRLVAQFSHSFTYSQIKDALYKLDPYVSCWFHSREYVYEDLGDKKAIQAHHEFCHELLSRLRPLFLDLHQTCFEKHPHPRIERELEILTSEMN